MPRIILPKGEKICSVPGVFKYSFIFLSVKKLWMVLKVPEWQRGRESGKIEDAGQVIGAE